MDNIINKQFNELTIKKRIKNPRNGKYKSWRTPDWVHCICSCGEEVDVPLNGVITNRIKSCGHLRSELSKQKIEKVRKEHPHGTFLTYQGKTLNLAEWSRETGIPRTTLLYRYKKGLPVYQILEKRD